MRKTRSSLIYKSFLCVMLAAALLLAAIPAFAAAPLTGTVRNLNGGSYVNLREHPAYFGKILARISLGTQVEIIGREGDWYAVNACGRTGYMHSFFVRTSDGASAPCMGSAYVRTYHGGKLNLRTYASTCADSLGKFASGTPVTILDYQPTWCKVSVCGKVGYMKSEYLAIGTAMAAKPNVKKEAAQTVIDASVLVPARELPANPCTNENRTGFEMPKWQLSWADPAPIVPENCFIPVK